MMRCLYKFANGTRQVSLKISDKNDEKITYYEPTNNVITMGEYDNKYNIIISDNLTDIARNIEFFLKEGRLLIFVSVDGISKEYCFNIKLGRRKRINLFDDYKYIYNNFCEYYILDKEYQQRELTKLLLGKI